MQWHVLVDILITSDDAVVLLRREDEDVWHLPGGPLVEMDDPAEVAKRLVQEQVNLALEDVRLVWVEARNTQQGPTLVLHYEADAPGYPSPGPNIAETRLFQVEHLPTLDAADREALYITLTGGDTFQPF